MYYVLLLTVLCEFVNSEFYDTFSGKPINRTRYEEFNKLGLVPYCAIQVAPCDPYEPRRMDGSCNNPRYPTRGPALTPYRRLLPPTFSAGGGLPTSASGKPLPLARPLRVALVSDGRQASPRYTHMVANYNLFITSDITSVHDTVNYVTFTRHCCQPGGREDPRCIPVEVQDDDLHLRRSNVRCMNLTRAITYQRLGCISDDIPPERINTASPMLDLSPVYGYEERGARLGREFSKGRLRAEVVNGKEWPPSGSPVCVNNVPPRETRCHDGPSTGANSVLGLNLLVMWLYRSHNALADALYKVNPCWDDNKLYYTAKEVNVAYFNHIMYYEMMTELIGWDFLLKNKVVYPTRGHVNDYDPALEPRVSIEYVAATRWFHTLQEGRLKLYTRDGRHYDEVSVIDFILRTGALPLNNTIEGMTQGTFRQPGADVDALVDPDVGERILGRLQFASDVVSSDILKGRDVGLPPYNRYRKLCGLPEADKFEDLLGWMDRTQVEAMGRFYEHPADIDLLAGLLAERAMPGAALGPTLACIMVEQLLYWRRADRFWYEHDDHPGAFSQEQLLEIRKMTLAKLICQHGDGVDAVQPYAFIVPGPGNEITKCSEYEMPNLEVFRDDRCYPRPTPSREEYYPSTPDFLEQGNLDQYYALHSDHPNPNANILKLANYLNFNPSTNERYSGPYNSDKTNQQNPKSDPFTSTNQGDMNSKVLSNANPAVNPKVTIHPNADPTISNKESPGVVSIQSFSNNPATPRFYEYSNKYPGILRNTGYPNLNPVLGVGGYPYDLSLNRKSSNANPFQDFLSYN